MTISLFRLHCLAELKRQLSFTRSYVASPAPLDEHWPKPDTNLSFHVPGRIAKSHCRLKQAVVSNSALGLVTRAASDSSLLLEAPLHICNLLFKQRGETTHRSSASVPPRCNDSLRHIILCHGCRLMARLARFLEVIYTTLEPVPCLYKFEPSGRGAPQASEKLEILSALLPT